MSLWKFTVSEIIAREVEYIVEASTREEAIKKASEGDTIEEDFVGEKGVMDRHIEDGPCPCEQDAEGLITEVTADPLRDSAERG